jgi:aldehyde dehydrogenase (NAD(P)+)
VHTRPGGQLVVDVYPTNLTETLLLSGYTAEVWQDPALGAADLAASVATIYRGEAETRGVSAVMGAGNIASITPLDILYALVAEGRTVIAKLSPVNGYLEPFLTDAFAEFIAEDWVRLVQGDGATGEQIVTHPKVRAVHVTGSAATHDAIVFGTGPDAAEARAAGTSRLSKPVTAELGGVTPTIVVPGSWTDRDLRFQAEHIATQKLHNAGHNCIATQVVILPADWPQADAFAAHLEAALTRIPARDQYYPGSDDRHAAILAAAPTSRQLGASAPGRLLAELDATADEPAFQNEAFGTFLGIVRLPGATDDYLRAATDFANDRLAGTLGANVLVDPKTAKTNAAALDAAIADLRYGSIAVNAWAGVGFLLGRATWGAFPGATPADIQSGTGIVHNAYLFGRAQKTVVRAPFRPFPHSVLSGQLTLAPKPPWFVTNRTAATTSARLTHFAARPNVLKLAGVFASALRG